MVGSGREVEDSHDPDWLPTEDDDGDATDERGLLAVALGMAAGLGCGVAIQINCHEAAGC